MKRMPVLAEIPHPSEPHMNVRVQVHSGTTTDAAWPPTLRLGFRIGNRHLPRTTTAAATAARARTTTTTTTTIAAAALPLFLLLGPGCNLGCNGHDNRNLDDVSRSWLRYSA